MQARACGSLKPFDDSVAQLRHHVEALEERARSARSSDARGGAFPEGREDQRRVRCLPWPLFGLWNCAGRSGDPGCPGRFRTSGGLSETSQTVVEGIIAAPVSEVWRVFSTAEGYKALGVAQARMDFRPGGLILTSYDPDATLGDEKTIQTEIITYDPGRMIATRIHQPPKGIVHGRLSARLDRGVSHRPGRRPNGAACRDERVW